MDTWWIHDPDAVAEIPPPAIGSGIDERLGGLVFDVIGVLYDNSPWRRWFLQLLHRIGLHTHYDVFYRVWEQEFQHAVACGQRAYWDAMGDYLRASGLSPGQITEVEAAGRGKREELDENIHPLPGVIRTLQRLRGRGVRLAVACSVPWPLHELHARLDQMHLGQHFTHIVSTHPKRSDTTMEACIEEAVDYLDLPARQCGWVGCAPAGLQAARRANLCTIAINQPADAVAQLYLRRFDDLLSSVHYLQLQRMAG